MQHLLKFILTVVFVLPLSAVANPWAEVKLLTPACEESLALSALPERLRQNASVYVLTNDGFTLKRKGDGPFTCIVERNHKNALIPQCPDAAGADSIIPGIVQKSEWAIEGLSAEERTDNIQRQAAAGELHAPSRPGVSYMMSNFNYIWSAQSGALTHVPPHVMFYAPNLSNDDIGGSIEEGFDGNRGYPFIIEEGIHGYITTLVEHASDSSDVLAACEGQIPELPSTVNQQATSTDLDGS